jgi:L-xylulokinase
MTRFSAYLLGIDNGGTATKAALYDTAGNEVAVAGIKTEMLFPHPGFTERNLDQLWTANVRVIAEVLKKADVDPRNIKGVSVTGHGNGLYLVDKAGNPVHNGINSADSRASAYVKTWYQDGTFERVLPRTCQSIWAGQPVPLLAWFQDHLPEALARTRWIFMCKDYIRFRLTGEACAEVTDYSGTNLVNVRDIRYDEDLLSIFGIPGVRDKLPPLRRSAEICGKLTQEAARETGLKAGTPVAGGLFDIDACAIATGITDPQMLCIIAGSWSINQYICPRPVESCDLFMTSVYCIPGYWLIMEGSPTSASNLEWFVSELMGGEKGEAEKKGASVYDLCNALVEGVDIGESDVVFLPFLFGSNEGPNASSCFVGLRGWHRKAHLLRSIFEGIVFSHRTHIDRLMSYRDRPRLGRISGGAAKSAVWVQMFADALQLPIEITASEELGAMGAAICAGVGTGVFSSFEDAVSRTVRVSRVIEPRPHHADLYEQKYARYKKIIAALRDV